MATIYALLDPRLPGYDAIRYIGVTNHSLKNRLGGHIADSTAPSMAHAKGHRRHWIRKLVEEGVRPVIAGLEQTSGDCWEREKQLIGVFRKCGVRLVNDTDGGEGTLGRFHSEATKKRMSLGKKGKRNPKVSAALLGRPLPEERRARLVAYYADPEHRRLAGAKNVGRVLTPEQRAKVSAAGRGRRQSAESIAKRASAQRGRKMPEAQRAWMVAHHRTPEYRAALSEKKRVWWANRKASSVVGLPFEMVA
jgi:hypothetical protein